jgi:hypothetical protein
MNYSNVYNMMHATSVHDGVADDDIPNSSDCISSSVDSIRQCSSVSKISAVHLSMCHCHASQATSSQVSTSYDVTIDDRVGVSEVGSKCSRQYKLGFFPTSFYYDRGVML